MGRFCKPPARPRLMVARFCKPPAEEAGSGESYAGQPTPAPAYAAAAAPAAAAAGASTEEVASEADEALVGFERHFA